MMETSARLFRPTGYGQSCCTAIWKRTPSNRCSAADVQTRVSLHGFTFNNRHLLLVTNAGRDKDALVAFDPIAGTEVRQIYAHPDVDVLSPLLSRHRRRMEGVVYLTDRLRYAFFDERTKGGPDGHVDGRFPGLQASIVGRSQDEKRLLILVSGDRHPGGYYAVDIERRPYGKTGRPPAMA